MITTLRNSISSSNLLDVLRTERCLLILLKKMTNNQFVEWLGELLANSDSLHLTPYQSNLIRKKYAELGVGPQVDGDMPEYFGTPRNLSMTAYAPQGPSVYLNPRPSQGVEPAYGAGFMRSIYDAMGLHEPDAGDFLEAKFQAIDKANLIERSTTRIVEDEPQWAKDNRATM